MNLWNALKAAAAGVRKDRTETLRVGFPGLALVHYDQEKCTAALHKAFERGLNYYDVAPAYGNGQCETKKGIGLQGLDRSKYFLACKTKKRDKEGCRKELEESLRLLKTDYFDLYQMHHLVRPAEVQQALGRQVVLHCAH